MEYSKSLNKSHLSEIKYPPTESPEIFLGGWEVVKMKTDKKI